MSKHENMETLEIFEVLEENEEAKKMEEETTLMEEKEDERDRKQRQISQGLKEYRFFTNITPFSISLLVAVCVGVTPGMLVSGIIEAAADGEDLKIGEFLDTVPDEVADQWRWLNSASGAWMGTMLLSLLAGFIICAIFAIKRYRSNAGRTLREERRIVEEEWFAGMSDTELEEECKIARNKAAFAHIKCRFLFNLLPLFAWLMFLMMVPSIMGSFGFEARKIFGPAKV